MLKLLIFFLFLGLIVCLFDCLIFYLSVCLFLICQILRSYGQFFLTRIKNVININIENVGNPVNGINHCKPYTAGEEGGRIHGAIYRLHLPLGRSTPFQYMYILYLYTGCPLNCVVCPLNGTDH